MSLLHEFKEFALRGNVFDLAIGVVIGGAFGKIVTSLVSDIISPIIGKITSGVDFSTLSLVIGVGRDGSDIVIKYGSFITATIDFVIIAFCIFLAVKQVNRFKKKEEKKESEKTVVPPEEVLLLREIRDHLKNTN